LAKGDEGKIKKIEHLLIEEPAVFLGREKKKQNEVTERGVTGKPPMQSFS